MSGANSMSVNKTPIKLLYVEDDLAIQEEMAEILTFDYPDLIVASDGEEALRYYNENHIDIIISDVHMPKMDGLCLTKKIMAINPDAVIILMTALDEADFIEQTQQVGTQFYVNKPIILAQLEEVLKQACALVSSQ